MKIALLGGSFDPIHIGHIEMAKCAIKQLQVDEVWFVLAKCSPLKEVSQTSYEDRAKMLSLAIAPYRKFKLCNIEQKLADKSYTIDTIKALKKNFPTHSFYFLMGEDQVANLVLWKSVDQLQYEVALCAFARNNKQVQTKYLVRSLHMPMMIVSSSEIRSGKRYYMPKAVRHYVSSHGLYLAFIKQHMSTARYEHSLRVAELCAQIARANAYDANIAYMSGLLHDINKEHNFLSVAQSQILLQHMKPEYLQHEVGIWHGFSGAYICKHQLYIQNKHILNAIEHHVLGSSRNPYAMILFVSDKLEVGRGYDSSASIAICKKDIKKGFALVLQQVANYYKEKKDEFREKDGSNY